MANADLRVVRAPPEGPRHGEAPAGADLGLLAFLLALHALPLVAFAAGRDWGAVATGYGAVVVLLLGRELVRELRTWARAASRGCQR
jgi:hypothetical protein